MSHIATAAAMEMDHLATNPRFVLLIIADCHNASNGDCFPSLCYIAKKTSLSESSVRRAIDALIEANLIAKSPRRAPGGRQCSNSYELLFLKRPEPCQCAPETEEKGGCHTDRGRVSHRQGGGVTVTPPINEPGIEPGKGNYTVPASANDLSEKLIEAGGDALANPANSPGLLVLSEPQRWLVAGCDLTLDILPTITARSANARPGSIKSWSFFTQAIADAKATREAPMPTGTAALPRGDSYSDRQRRMRAELAAINARRAN